MIWPPRKRVTLTSGSYQKARPGRPEAADRLAVMSTEPYSLTDIALAGRNRSMPIEMLRHDVTPVGMHYMLTHFDIPDLDVAAWRLEIGGMVEAPRTISLGELRAMDAVTHAVTMECAGNGRTLLSPRPTNQPWGLEAVSTAEWTGVPLRDVLGPARVRPDAVEVVFTGADEGTQNGVRHRFQRSLSVGEAERPEVLLAYAMNGRPLEPQHGAPVRLIVPGWYGMASVKWITAIEAVGEPFTGYQQARSYNIRQGAEDAGERVTRIAVRALMVPPGRPDFPTLARVVDAGDVPIDRPGLVRGGARHEGRGRRRRTLVRRSPRRAGRAVRLAPLVVRLAGRAGRPAAVMPRDGRRRAYAAARAGMEPRWLLQQHGADGRADRRVARSSVGRAIRVPCVHVRPSWSWPRDPRPRPETPLRPPTRHRLRSDRSDGS